MDCSDSFSDVSDGADDYDYYDASDDFCSPLDEPSHSEDPDLEYVEYSCLDVGQVETLMHTTIGELAASASVEPSVAKLLLHSHGWDADAIRKQLHDTGDQLLVEDGLKADKNPRKRPRISAESPSSSRSTSAKECAVCCEDNVENLLSLDCGHLFCQKCWESHVETQLANGIAARIQCMETDCRLLCQESFIIQLLANKPRLKTKYNKAMFRELVDSHPHLRWCTGRRCNTIVACKTNKAHRITCTNCSTSFCVKCGEDYHAPASCEIIKKWLIKCADDSETANYISAHTKDCPNCHSCIEKNGGCNHIQCAKCKYHFCWMCFRDWKTHGSEYYECSRYKENPSIAQEANHLKARRALEKYLHYFERFENHNKSLKMEEELRAKIKKKIDEKVNRHEGTWIDWQYLHDAATLLTKCRYTLQYTYPFAYYMESGPRKELFEYQQAQLEKEIEELSWKVERAETTDRGDLENQMHVAERKRRTLFQDFFN
ncbi:Protein T12E12.1 [Aphelenchoides avenae]|nr:Protein T12E12.1 [Aphelenchus avenae]